MTDKHPVYTAAFEQLKFFAQTGQPCRRLLRRKQLARMRFEGHHRRWQPKAARLRREPLEQRLMAAVQTIEIADGQHARRRRLLRDTAKNQHGDCSARKERNYTSRPAAGRAAEGGNGKRIKRPNSRNSSFSRATA